VGNVENKKVYISTFKHYFEELYIRDLFLKLLMLGNANNKVTNM
jgi:hypothetical protein